jgi:hypothetical protein
VEEQAVNATTVTLRLNFSYLQGEALERFRGILFRTLVLQRTGWDPETVRAAQGLADTHERQTTSAP